VLPLGKLTKVKVREIASSLGLESADKPDSQENCFINGKDYATYILNRLDTNPVKGEFISPDGKVCGQHQGIIHYTIGQRRGLNIALGERVFIKEINPSENRIYLARQGENLYSSTMIEMVTTIDDMPLKEDTYLVKIRSTAKGVPAKIIPKADGYAYVEFLEPQTAVCSGQSLVIYTDDKLIGGGIINTLLK
ncbi:MAG: tRNA methyl transferase PRC-barrel domain-containing protein, partial [Oscillospiraceae bacterium]